MNAQSQIQLVFGDRPGNDLTSLATTITDVHWTDDADTANLDIFPSMIPRSFYTRVMPSRSVDAGFSLATLHHLDHVPALAAVPTKTR